MPRILGVDIPNDKKTHISLRYIYGIGPTTALHLCEQARVDPLRRARELSDDDISRLAAILDRDYTVILLTNRIHPLRSNLGIKKFRPVFHDLVMEGLLGNPAPAR